ncbi:MAG: hypothetical protein GWN47_00615 [Woeseiaceae bacterium]|nr:hypothetical protein [Woeseiaceae bacterium]
MTAVIQPGVTIEAFEAGAIDVGAFDHEAHVYVGWLYLERYSLLDAIGRYTAALQRLTRQLGIPGKYHETITWFFLVLIEERRSRAKTEGWTAFRLANPDLCLEADAILRGYYSRELLASPLARTSFLLPDSRPRQAV